MTPPNQNPVEPLITTARGTCHMIPRLQCEKYEIRYGVKGSRTVRKRQDRRVGTPSRHHRTGHNDSRWPGTAHGVADVLSASGSSRDHGTIYALTRFNWRWIRSLNWPVYASSRCPRGGCFGSAVAAPDSRIIARWFEQCACPYLDENSNPASNRFCFALARIRIGHHLRHAATAWPRRDSSLPAHLLVHARRASTCCGDRWP